MNQVIQEVQKPVNREFGISVVVKQKLPKSSEPIKISIIPVKHGFGRYGIEEEKQIYFEMVLNQIRSKNTDLFKRADLIIFAGGGANYAPDYLPESKTISILCQSLKILMLTVTLPCLVISYGKVTK